jgi:hypothetical protein
MIVPTIESAVLVSARQLADEARERRWAVPTRRSPAHARAGLRWQRAEPKG